MTAPNFAYGDIYARSVNFFLGTKSLADDAGIAAILYVHEGRTPRPRAEKNACSQANTGQDNTPLSAEDTMLWSTSHNEGLWRNAVTVSQYEFTTAQQSTDRPKTSPTQADLRYDILNLSRAGSPAHRSADFGIGFGINFLQAIKKSRVVQLDRTNVLFRHQNDIIRETRCHLRRDVASLGQKLRTEPLFSVLDHHRNSITVALMNTEIEEMLPAFASFRISPIKFDLALRVDHVTAHCEHHRYFHLGVALYITGLRCCSTAHHDHRTGKMAVRLQLNSAITPRGARKYDRALVFGMHDRLLPQSRHESDDTSEKSRSGNQQRRPEMCR
ncbi:hypothetical protein [Marivita sp.]|uniref:hypothetical protein n=1 Tax=Marivita sp. TaxID=2003365 RepID=UPI003B524945